MDDRAEAVDNETVLASFEQFVEEPEEEVGEPEQLEAEAENSEESETETAESDQEADNEPVMEIQWGEELKPVTKAELKELAERGYNYTQKMQELAENRRSFEAQSKLVQTQIEIHSKLSDKVAEIKGIDSQIAQYKQLDWAKLAEEDPVQYMQLNQRYQSLKEVRQDKVNEYSMEAQNLQAQQAEATQQMEKAEAALLFKKVPELSSDQAKNELINYLTNEGFSAEEISSIRTHKAYVVAWKAAQFDKLKSAKPEITKRVANVPKMVKGNKPAPKNASRELKEQLRKTGNDAIAAKIIEGTL